MQQSAERYCVGGVGGERGDRATLLGEGSGSRASGTEAGVGRQILGIRRDYYPVRGFPEARPCHGREEITGFLTEFCAAWEGYGYVLKDLRAIGDDRVFVHGRIKAEGRASGAKLEGDIYHCCWLRHGRFIRVEDHLTEKEALHALGLSE
jgi:hypothetical protein